jgi:hypothetical protein
MAQDNLQQIESFAASCFGMTAGVTAQSSPNLLKPPLQIVLCVEVFVGQ